MKKHTLKKIPKIILITALLISLIFAACGCADGAAVKPAGNSQVQDSLSQDQDGSLNTSDTAESFFQISQDEAKEMMEQDDGHIVVDVRTFEEYESGHIPTAICIPNEDIKDETPELLPDKNQIILIYCRSGNRSKQASQKLFDMGYSQIYEFGGINDWTGEIVTGPQPGSFSPADNANNSSDIDSAKYITKETPVFRKELTSETVDLRFYANMPSVAYMGISEYYSMMMPGAEMTVTKVNSGSNQIKDSDNSGSSQIEDFVNSGSNQVESLENFIQQEQNTLPQNSDDSDTLSPDIYMLTSKTGKAVIDTNNDILVSENFSDFANLMPLVQEGMPNVYLDGAPYLRFLKAEYEYYADPASAGTSGKNPSHESSDPSKDNPASADTSGNKPSKESSDPSKDDSASADSGEDMSVPSIFSPENQVAEPVPIIISFSDYGIDIIGDDNDVYFPVATLSDMFSDLYYHYSSYNGEKIYVNSDQEYSSAPRRDPDYYKPVFLSERKADMADFAYRELCFAVDHFYGFSGLSFLEKEYDLQNSGLDHALEAMGDPGKKTKEFLCSEDMADYLTGLARLDSILSDGAHTSFCISTSFFEIAPTLEEEIDRRFSGNGKKEYFYDLYELLSTFRSTPGEDYSAMLHARTASFGEEETYIKLGDTAVCVLDSFNDLNKEGWNEYYEGGPLPSDDSLSVFVDAFDKARSDPEVKNLVIDLTFNGGGSLDVLAAMLAMTTGANHYRYTNVLENRIQDVYYETDKNLDGSFDERDNEFNTDLRFAVLTSGFSFSCANYFPSVMKDQGVLILGSKSAGGSCAIERLASADGLIFKMSSHLARLTNNNNEIPEGIPVDVELTQTDADGNKDYSDFYDIEKLSRLMNDFYDNY